MNKGFIKKICALSVAATMLASLSINAVGSSTDKDGGGDIVVSNRVYKTEDNANPISPVKFCADPTSIEYNGRLYVYGTSDHEQSEKVGLNGENHYGFIYSLEVFSTDDMVNWEYHGKINVKEIAPWITNAWAPSIVSRVEDDGLTHFYMYFSNNGIATAVITSTDPVVGWKDPLGKNLVDISTPGLGGGSCPNPFDPGVVIDDDGTGWLTFGGGNPGEYKTTIAKIVKLGDDMISLASDFVGIETPYFNEASELNYINGTFVYSYCNDWQERKSEVWDYEGIEKPHGCSIAYLTSKTPLDAASWEYKGEYLLNAGDSLDGMAWCNNHSHLQKFKDKWYLLHHTMVLAQAMNIKGGFRSICVEKVDVDEKNVTISLVRPTKAGVSQNGSLNPYISHSGSELFTCADIDFSRKSDGTYASKSLENGSWINIKGADFAHGATDFSADVKGKGSIEVRLDDINSQPVATIDFNADNWQTVNASSLKKFDSGKHDIYLVFSDKSIELASWKFAARNVSNEVQVGENAPETVLGTSLQELIDAVLTKDEKDSIADGVEVKINLTVNDATNTVSNEDKSKVEAAINGLENFKLGQYLDVNLKKIIGGIQKEITEASAPISITFEIPEALQGDDRNYSVIRVHNGETAVLSDLDNDKNTITIETDRFSTYALVYSEKASVTTPDDSASDSDEPTPDDSTSDSNEPTPDESGSNSIEPTPDESSTVSNVSTSSNDTNSVTSESVSDDDTDNPPTGIALVSLIPLAAAITGLTFKVKRKKK